MKIRNRHVYDTPARIREIAEETRWIGRHDYEIIDEGHLVIYSIPRRKVKKKRVEEESVEERPATRKGNGYRKD